MIKQQVKGLSKLGKLVLTMISWSTSVRRVRNYSRTKGRSISGF